MSGGNKNYIYSKIDSYLCGQMQDIELNDLMNDIRDLAHDLEWAESGDYSFEDYFQSVKEFKEKWFIAPRTKRLEKYINKKIAETKEELLKLIK